MTLLDTRPQVVDVDHYGGDTLPIHIKVADGFVRRIGPVLDWYNAAVDPSPPG